MNARDVERLAQEFSLERAREEAGGSDTGIVRVTWKILSPLTPIGLALDLMSFHGVGLLHGWLQWRAAPELQTYHALPLLELRRGLWLWRLASIARSFLFFVFIASLFVLIPLAAYAVCSWAHGGADARDARALAPVVLATAGVTIASLAGTTRLDALMLPGALRPMLGPSLFLKSVAAVEP